MRDRASMQLVEQKQLASSLYHSSKQVNSHQTCLLHPSVRVSSLGANNTQEANGRAVAPEAKVLPPGPPSVGLVCLYAIGDASSPALLADRRGDMLGWSAVGMIVHCMADVSTLLLLVTALSMFCGRGNGCHYRPHVQHPVKHLRPQLCLSSPGCPCVAESAWHLGVWDLLFCV